MGELDLQHAFARGGALAENLEDQAGAVEHLGAGFLFEIALLHRSKRCIEEQQLDLLGLNAITKRFDLPGPQQGRGLHLANLDDLGEDRSETDRRREALELGLAHLDRVRRRRPANIGDDEAGAGRRDGMVNRARAARGVLAVKCV